MFSTIMSSLSERVSPRRPVETTTHFILGFQPDRLNATIVEAGVLTIRGERFVSFNWSVDYRAMDFGPLVEEIFRTWPHSMRNLVLQWPSYRDRDVPDHLRCADDPDNIVDFISVTLSKSSLFVVRVEETP